MDERSNAYGSLASIPTDKNLQVIASTIGYNWELMAPHLFKEDSRVKVEQIKQDNPGQSVNQIFKLLLTWRKQTGCAATLQHLFYQICQAKSVTIEWDTIASKLGIDETEIRRCILPADLGAIEQVDGTHIPHLQDLDTTDGYQLESESLHHKMKSKSYRPPKDACIFDGRLIKLEREDIKSLNDNCTIKIGEGGFGKVYKSGEVLDGFGIRVALKKVHADTPEKLKSARREMIASRIMHPFTLPLLAVLERENSEFWFISPYCENGDLHRAIRRDVGPNNNVNLKQTIRVRILWQISLAIQYLHTAVPNVRDVILHKDISSKNVVLDVHFNARLIDFGLAREKGDQTTTAQGKMLYSHPNVGRGIPACENWDYYSFGVVIREVLTGLEPMGINDTYLKFMEQEEVLKHTQLGIWSQSYSTTINEIARDCLQETRVTLKFGTIVIKKLKDIYKCSNPFNTLEVPGGSRQCDICMINPEARDTSMNQAHASNCTQKISVCIACVKNSFLNPITCYCGTELKPSIGCGWGALLVAGNDTENTTIAEAVMKDVIEIKNVITSKAPLIMGISEDKVWMVVPSKPGNPEELWPNIREEITHINQDKNVTTLFMYISCHGKGQDITLLQLGSAADTISMDDFKLLLETLENVENILLFLDCCNPRMIHLDKIKIIQINACKEDQKASVTSKGSTFTKYLIQGLKAKSERTKCTDKCRHCKTYWDTRTDFISVASLFDYINNHMANIDQTPCRQLNTDFSNIAFYTDEEVLIDFENVSGDEASPKIVHHVRLEYFQKMKQLEDKLLKMFQKNDCTYTVRIEKDTYRKKNQLELCDTLEKVMSAWVHRQPLLVTFERT